MSEPVDYTREVPPPSNPIAVISVVAGLLLCVPGTGVLAIPAGLYGMRRARRIGGLGATPARIGLVLGIINLVWWAALLGGAYNTYRSYLLSEPAIDPTKKFVMLVGSGNIGGAKALCTDAIDEARLTDTCEQIQKWGELNDVDARGGRYGGPSDVEIRAALKFNSTTKIMVSHWTMTGGSPKLTAYEFHDGPPPESTTQPIAPAASQPR